MHLLHGFLGNYTDWVSGTRIYIACGINDYWLSHSRNFRDLLIENGFDVTYGEGPGGHEWDLGDTYIKWLPLDEVSHGINSRNVNK